MFGAIGSAISGILSSNQNPLNSGFGSMTGGIFPAGINQLGDNFMNGYMNYYFSDKLANKQNQRMIDFWNMQNAYNTPAAQMARFKEAGLNPNLIYGQTNTASPIGTPSVGSFHMPNDRVNAGPLDIMSALQAYYGIKNMQEQNSLINAQSDYTKAQADRMRYETKWLKKNSTSSFESPYLRSGKSLFSSLPAWYFNFVDWMDSFVSSPRLRAVGDGHGPSAGGGR